MAIKPALLELYLVTDRTLSPGRPLTEVVAAAARGGVSLVQLREKEASTREFIELARAVKAILEPYPIPLIINDRADVALAAEADGLHIGQSDMLYGDARCLLGPEAIIGLSVEGPEQAREAREMPGLDYIAVSPVFRTPTKTDTAEGLGVEGIREIRRIAGPGMPIVSIGGIDRENIPEIIRAGSDGVAVVSAICSADSPEQAARELLTVIKQAKGGDRHIR